MEITVKSNPAKIATLAVALVVFLMLAVWVGRACLAAIIAGEPTTPNLRAALLLDPSDSQYALSLGRTYQYSVMEARPTLAIQYLTRAIRLNAANPQAWLDLGTALEFQGHGSEAEACMRRVDALAPHIPSFEWATGNFFLLHNNVNRAFRRFRRVLAGNTGYEPAIFNTAWKASGDGEVILNELIPNQPRIELDYLDYLIGTQRLDEAQPVWQRILRGPGKFSARGVAPFMDALIGAHQADAAYQVWGALRDKDLIPPTDESTPQNLVENGDFEEPILGFGFDWRIAQVSGIYTGLDDSTYHSPAHSLLIQFSGKQNVDYHNVFQFVPVEPGQHYHLQGYMKTEGITTDSGPRFEVRDAYNPVLLDKYTDQLTGTTQAWMPLSLDFVTPPDTHLITVNVARIASQEFENQIAGKFWVDDLTLTSASH